MLLPLLPLLLLVRGASAACECSYTDQTYDAATWPTFFIQNPFDGDSPCAGNCTYNLYSGDPSQGIGDFKVIQWNGDAGASTITVYNTDVNGNPIYTNPPVNQGNTGPTSVSFTSTSSHVQVILTMSGQANILATLDHMSGLSQPATTTTPPPPPATTTPYNGIYKNDPASISNDILFMVDGGKNGAAGVVGFNLSKQLAAAIIEAFPASSVCVGTAGRNDRCSLSQGSRLALNSLTKINTGALVQPWHATPDTVAGLIKGLPMVQTIQTNYTDALNALLTQTNSPFMWKNPSGYEYQNSRAHAQRTLVVVASSVPQDADLTGFTSRFLALDVHPVFVAYNFSVSDRTTLGTKLTGWAIFDANDTSDATVQSFVNDFLLDASNVCASTVMKSGDFTVPVKGLPKVIKLPTSYEGAENPDDPWNTEPQRARYCNFQYLEYHFKVADQDNDKICFTVFYELETDKDLLTFYFDDGSGDKKATFTGYDVSGSKFSATGNVKAVFTTNADTVFGGFEIQYEHC